MGGSPSNVGAFGCLVGAACGNAVHEAMGNTTDDRCFKNG